MEKLTKDAIDLEKAGLFGLFSKFFIPTLLGMLCMSAVTAIDGIFIGHGVGADGIAAVNICVPIFMLGTGIGLMVGAGCSVVASIHLAEGKVKAARLNVTLAMIFSTICMAIPILAMMIFPSETGRLLGASDELLPMVKEYMMWFMPGIVCQMWAAVGLFVIRLDGSPKYAMYCNLVTAVVNAFLDWFLIFPMGWGLMGAALASSLAMTLGGVMALGYLLFSAKTLWLQRLKWSFRSLRYSLRNIGYQCKIGSPAFIGEITMAVFAFMGNQVFMHYLGDNGVGAFGIACYYTPFCFMVGNAIAQSAQPIISYNFGLGNLQRVSKTLRIALGTATCCGLLSTLAFCLFPHLLVGLFVDPECEAGRLAIEGFPYFSMGFVFFIINLTFVGYYQSIERVGKATAYSLIRGFLYLVPSFLIMPLLLGEKGIWLALGVSELLTTCTILMVRKLR